LVLGISLYLGFLLSKVVFIILSLS
jgi:hypothetical protein